MTPTAAHEAGFGTMKHSKNRLKIYGHSAKTDAHLKHSIYLFNIPTKYILIPDGINLKTLFIIPGTITPLPRISPSTAIFAVLSADIAHIGVFSPSFSKNFVLVVPGHSVLTTTPLTAASCLIALLAPQGQPLLW